MTLLPTILRQELKANARESDNLTLASYKKVRDFIAENEDAITAYGWIKFYKDVGDDMNRSWKTVSNNLVKIRNYPDEKLDYWFQNDVSFDHLETANHLQNVKECKYDASTLLDKCIELGGANGKRMTVEEMTVFALGEREYVAGRAGRYLIDRLLKFGAGQDWDKTKLDGYNTLIEQLRDYLER